MARAAPKLDCHQFNHEKIRLFSTYLIIFFQGHSLWERWGAAAHSGSKFADLDSILMGTGEGMDGSNVKSISIN